MMQPPRWHPAGTAWKRRPEPGKLLAHRHAVWSVVAVEDTALTDDEERDWLAIGLPELGRTYPRPYRITLEWVAGAQPDQTHTHVRQVGGRQHVAFRVRAGSRRMWDTYPDRRWPQCSCCGEPVPCRATERDEMVAAGSERMSRHMAVPAGACWGCTEPITSRQKSVAYPGDNLDLPGGPEVRFHTRGSCRRELLAYEERWLAVDPRRERIYTWPRCVGMLTTHADGTSECHQGPAWPHAGVTGDPHPDCRGHLTHDHGSRAACHDEGCPRGCGPNNYIRLASRPERHDQQKGSSS